MIWVTGDCHGDYNRFTSEWFPDGKSLTKDDYVIVCGDFGFWLSSAEQDWWFKWLEQKNWTTLFVDGNHEDFDALNQLEVKEWHGGKIHQINSKIFHLMRGQVFDLQGYKFFTFGGAASHDISDGIIQPTEAGWIDKAKRWKKEGKMFRINHFSWWAEEMPNQDEMDEGLKNLTLNGCNVDFIITHECPTSVLTQIYNPADINQLNNYLQSIQDKSTYKRWYFGHHHINQMFGDTCCLYKSMERIA